MLNPSASHTRRAIAVLLASAAAAAVAPAVPAAATPATRLQRQANAEVLLELKVQSGLQQFVRAVSDPASARYRHYATVEQLARRFGARKTTRAAVTAWLGARGLRATVGPSGTYVVAHGTRAAVARAFDAHAALASAATATRGAELPIPAALRGAVSAAALLSSAPVAQSAPVARPADVSPVERDRVSSLIGSGFVRTGTPAGCAAGRNAGTKPFFGFTPNQYLTAYGHAALQRRGLHGQGQRVALLETDGFHPSDVATFARCFGLRVPPIRAHAVGLRSFPAAGDETTLDLEVLSAAAPGLKGIHVYASAGSAAGLLASASAAIANPRTRPNVISISLGICEPNLTAQVISARALNDVFTIAAGAGISVLAASGDDGSAGCANAKALLPQLAVDVPAALPSVTAVGGTNLQLDARNRLTREVVWNDAPATVAAGGGGLSVMFDRPWWQRGPGLAPGVGNDVTRVVPDVAALADLFPGYAVYCTAAACDSAELPHGGWQTFGGTSAATPLTAGGIVLANQDAARHGQRPIGFANPLIYALARGSQYHRVLNDVTHGSNDVGRMLPRDAGGGAPLGGWSASRSFDPASGWGSLELAGFSWAALAAPRATG
jgi:subtilase family serine protease